MFHVLLWINLVVNATLVIVVTIGYIYNRRYYGRGFYISAMVAPCTAILTSIAGLLW